MLDLKCMYVKMYKPMTTANTTMPISEVRKDLFNIMSKVQKPGVAYTVTENGRPTAVILSADEFESIIETLEIMHQYPNIMSEIAQARREYEAGKYITLDEYFSRKKKYVPTRIARKGAKATRSRTR